MLTELYTLIDDRESRSQEIAEKAELMYDEFSAFEKQKFKEKQMKKALQNQIQYIWNVDTEKVKNHIRQMVGKNSRRLLLILISKARLLIYQCCICLIIQILSMKTV